MENLNCETVKGIDGKRSKNTKVVCFCHRTIKEVITLKNTGISTNTKSFEIERSLKSLKNIAASERPEPALIITKKHKHDAFKI